MKRISSIACLLIFTSSLFSQNFEGVIKTKITYEDLAPELKAQIGFFPTSYTTYIKDNFIKLVKPSPMGGQTVVLSNSETGEVITLQDGMGNKIAVRTNSKDKEKDEELPEINYSDETKEILGYTCKKATFESGEIELTIFYAEELKHLLPPDQSKRLKGYPLQKITSMEQLTQIETVTEINEEKVKKIKLKIPPEYKEMTMEEIREMQGNMR